MRRRCYNTEDIGRKSGIYMQVAVRWERVCAAKHNAMMRATHGNGSIKCISINTGGRNKAWELASICTEQKYDIIFMQEIAMNEDNAVAFIGQAHNWGNRAFLSSCKELVKRDGQVSLQGGVAVLVHRRWKARRSSSFVCADGEFSLVDLGCVLVGSVYSRPRRLEGDLEEKLRRRLLSEDRRRAWILAGDWRPSTMRR